MDNNFSACLNIQICNLQQKMPKMFFPPCEILKPDKKCSETTVNHVCVRTMDNVSSLSVRPVANIQPKYIE